MTPRVTIIMPFSSEDPRRRHARLIVGRYYATEFPHWPRITSTDSAATFSRGRAINTAARQATTDVLLFNDADSLVPCEQIRQAVQLAAETPGLVWAYDVYRRLTATATEALTPDTYLDAFLGPFERHITGAPSHGCTAIRRDCFFEVGGYDEGFEGWGYEDLVLTNRCQSLWPSRRVEGDLVHLWHGGRRADDSPEDTDVLAVRRNLARFTGSRGFGYAA